MGYSLDSKIGRKALEQAAKKGQPWALEAQGKASSSKATINPSDGFRETKFGNVPVHVGDERFDSKLERRTFDRLVAEHGRQSVVRQVSMPIEGGRIRPDFMVIHERFEDGRALVEFIDAKGRETLAWKKSAKQLRERHGLAVRLMKKADL